MLRAGPAPSECRRQSCGEEDPEPRRGQRRRRSHPSARRPEAGGGVRGAVGLRRPARSRAEAGGAAAACAPCLWRPCLPGDAVTDPCGRSTRAALRPLHSAAGAVGRPPCAGRGRAGGAGPAREGGSALPGPQGHGPPRAGPGGLGARRGGGRPGSRRRAGPAGGRGWRRGRRAQGGPPGSGLHNHRPAAHGGGEALRDPPPAPSAPQARPARRAGRPGPRRALAAVLRGCGDLGRPGPGRACRAVEPVFRRRVLHMLLGLARVSPGRGRGRPRDWRVRRIGQHVLGWLLIRRPSRAPRNLRTITFVTS